jgi:hypothetical protein
LLYLVLEIEKGPIHPPSWSIDPFNNLPGFEIQDKSRYFAHLVANPDTARAFAELPLLYKISWMTMFINANF